jgi:hypothetical protein
MLISKTIDQICIKVNLSELQDQMFKSTTNTKKGWKQLAEIATDYTNLLKYHAEGHSQQQDRRRKL